MLSFQLHFSANGYVSVLFHLSFNDLHHVHFSVQRSLVHYDTNQVPFVCCFFGVGWKYCFFKAFYDYLIIITA